MGDALLLNRILKIAFEHTEVIMNTQSLKRFFGVFLKEEDGISSIEYALIASLIAVLIVGSVGVVGTRVVALFSLVSNCVTFAIVGTGSCA